MSQDPLCFDRARFQALLDSIECMAAGDLERQIPLSPERDALDALSHGVNVLSGELLYRLRELEAAQSSLIQSGKLAADRCQPQSGRDLPVERWGVLPAQRVPLGQLPQAIG